MDQLELQLSCFDGIKNLCVNYRKDSLSRKTEEYLNKRLSNLETLWAEFDKRHALLILEIEDKTISYFADDVYTKTKEMYVATKSDISHKLAEKANKKINIKFDLSGTSSVDQSSDSADDVQLLLNKQHCFFNAIYRIISKIEHVPITEKWELEDHLATLKSKWEPIDKTHWQIDFHLKGTNEQYYSMFAEVEQKYDDLKRKINAQIWSTAHYQKSAPKIEIPEFSGNYKQWISFKDLFLESVHKNPSINKAQKMQHLKSKLRGEAERLVQHLTISADNYSSCWDILSQRYDNRRLQFTSFMNTMLNLPVIQQPDAFNLKRIHDTITECLNGINNIGIDTTTWDPIIVHIMSQKLDSTTLSDYMKELQDHREVQNLQDFLSFLEAQFMAHETMKSAKRTTTTEKPAYNKQNKQFQMKKANYSFNKNYNYYATYGKCPLCNGGHVLRQCDKFLEMDTGKRNATVTKLQLCKNCLYSHGSEDCKSTKTCRECNQKHHTFLHNSDKRIMAIQNKKNFVEQRPTSSQQPTSNHLQNNNIEVLLTTVQVKVKCVDGTYITLRALLDQGSQVNLITENAAQMLRLPRNKINASVTGIGAVSGDAKGQLKLVCKSIHSDYSFETRALIMKRLTNNLPTTTFNKGQWPHLKNLKLADPDFNISRQIDLLLGAEVYSDIILDGVLKGDKQTPIAQQTHIGWILCGKMTKTFSCHMTLIDMDQITKFWENEDIQAPEDTTKDENCEQFYKDTVKRSQDGKYIVKMPLHPDYVEKLGNSKLIAISQFLQLEKRLNRTPKLSKMYHDFINEYADLGHMNMSPHSSTTNSCYLPHHGVLREHATSTKLRVVFNASQNTSNGYSLNSVMEKGPNLQKDIQTLILKWRSYKYVFTADIEKMYRCIWIAEDQRHLQKIVWRDSSDEPLRDNQLSTVTYGTKAAPWLAMRTLKQLAMDDGPMYPEAAKILQTECYVDDIISGHNDMSKAQNLQYSLIQLLKGGGMNLRKWTSNHPALLDNLNADQISTSFNFKLEEAHKTLGLGWQPASDTFNFNWSIKLSKKLTKRALLSVISKFYDPLGWLSPVTITAKLLFQKLWMTKLGWDDEVPHDIESEWSRLQSELHYVKEMTIDRWIGDTKQRIELLGFCDASEKAYACVIYSRIWCENGSPKITLLTSKTRVAPLAQKTTLPRLELCGAMLLANLMGKTIEALSEYDVSIQAWCDSQVVLAWIKGDLSRREPYVTNRVTKIKRIIAASNWRFVKSEDNPADCATRGLLPSKLTNFQLWWQGPTFLTKHGIAEVSISYETDNGCINHVKNIPKSCEEHLIITLLNKYSSLSFITRIVAWIKRFISTLRNKKKPNTEYLTTNELGAARTCIVSHMQRTEFDADYSQLLLNGVVSTKSKILKLNPYLDTDGVMRVGGRLKWSSLPPEMKNPAIVPHTSRYTQLLIEQAHLSTLHGGARLTLMFIRQQYWIVGGNRAVKTYLRKCVRCHRYNKTNAQQLMGDLPRQRITPSRAFTHTGVDFSGYVDIKHSKGRGVKTSKAYIAIFICMATKAVHLELVSDLSTETFIAAFQRLCARRGVPKHMYSDCGTNFIGASKVLHQEFEAFKQIVKPELFRELAKLEVEWHFNAPSWPSAGGLWEAAVKSMKQHLRRVLGDQKLTYEEFTTLLAKIEACLNSRPLCPLTENHEEFYNCLTPGHFLTGSPILSLPLSDYCDINNIDIRRRWQLVEHMLHQYWKNWSQDYLHTLQTRCKWNKPTKNIKVGDIVLVKDNNLPPGKWAMGRVLETHPGSDGLVRVTTIKTASGVMKRPVVKLSPLPLDSEIDGDENNKNQCEPKQQSQSYKKRNKTFTSLFLTIVTLFTFVSGCYSASGGLNQMSHAQITTLEPERPVYYDTVGKIQTMHDEWTLLMFYNLTNYWEGNQRLKLYIENLKHICDQSQLSLCQTTIAQLEHEMNLLDYYNFILINPHKHLSNRKKRGLIDGVGYVANSLFGVLDQHFAEKYENDIESLKNNEDYLLDLIKNQTSIMKLENNVLKQTEVNIQRQTKFINEFVNQTDLRILSMKSEIEILSSTTYINSASLTAYLLINSLRTFQEMLFNTLTNVYQGRVDVHLITPVHLIQQLSDIASSLPKTVSFPVENYKKNIKDIYSLITVKARVTENYFLFEARIPLVSDEDYVLYKAIPLPVKATINFTYVQISTKYIAVNLQKNKYILMTEEDLTKCTSNKENNYLCKKNMPSYDLHNNNAPCEAKLLSSHQNITPCRVEYGTCREAWIELHALNTWIAICCKECAIRTICNNDVKTSTILASSIHYTLPQGCVLQSNDLTIYAHRQYNSHMKMAYEFTVPHGTSINNIVDLTSHYPMNNLQPVETDLQKIDDSLVAQQESETTHHLTISGHDIHQYVISYMLLASAIIALVVAVGRKYRYLCLTKRHETGVRQEDIELQEYRRRNACTRTSESPSHDVVCNPDREPETSRHNIKTGTRNIAFNLD